MVLPQTEYTTIPHYAMPQNPHKLFSGVTLSTCMKNIGHNFNCSAALTETWTSNSFTFKATCLPALQQIKKCPPKRKRFSETLCLIWDPGLRLVFPAVKIQYPAGRGRGSWLRLVKLGPDVSGSHLQGARWSRDTIRRILKTVVLKGTGVDFTKSPNLGLVLT